MGTPAPVGTWYASRDILKSKYLDIIPLTENRVAFSIWYVPVPIFVAGRTINEAGGVGWQNI